ncbi:PAS domain S-box [Thiovulum sp. ES]|nr:PAS domain S-box [Thiovulum sp. ES]
MELLGLKKKEKFRKPKAIDKEYSFSQGEILVSKTDTKGFITYANEKFVKISGYSQSELLGMPHSMTRHPKMPKLIFKLLWKELKAGREINAFVKNIAKDGGFYWVFANVTPSFDVNNQIIGFHSTRRRASTNALKVIEPLYDTLRKNEIVGGIRQSEQVLAEILKEKGIEYDEFVYSIQHN